MFTFQTQGTGYRHFPLICLVGFDWDWKKVQKPYRDFWIQKSFEINIWNKCSTKSLHRGDNYLDLCAAHVTLLSWTFVYIEMFVRSLVMWEWHDIGRQAKQTKSGRHASPWLQTRQRETLRLQVASMIC